MELSHTTKMISGILLITVPTIEFGGVTLLKMLKSGEHGYLDSPVRQNLFRAGHAHAGVLVMQLFADALALPNAWGAIARLGVPAAAILMPLGFFLSVASPRAQKPNGLIALVYAGAVLLAAGTLALGVSLVMAA